MAAKLGSVEIEAFCWPTEDESKVLKALGNIAPLRYKKSYVEGHLGERIEVISGRASRQRDAEQALERVKGMAKPEMMDEQGRIAISLDKQALFKGEIAKGKGAKVTIKFLSFPSDIAEMRKLAESVLG